MDPAHGRCLCGAIEFTAELPSLWVAHCHCTLCQRNSGSAFVTWVGLDENRCRIDDKKAQLRWYQSTPGAERGFCANCGSTLFFRSRRWAGELHATLANFDTPIDRAPQAHVFWDTHVPWLTHGNDGLPRKTATETS